MNGFFSAALVVAVAFLSGCAHPLAVTPDIAKIETDGRLPKIEKNVGFYLDPQLRDAERVNEVGSGDSLTYKPFRDIETAFFKMLTNVFKGVSVLSQKDDAAAISRNSLSYIVTIDMTTHASTTSMLTWPPTLFRVLLKTSFVDSAGKNVLTTNVPGEGRAEFEEFKTDFSLAGKRAMLDVLLKTQDELLKAKELR